MSGARDDLVLRVVDRFADGVHVVVCQPADLLDDCPLQDPHDVPLAVVLDEHVQGRFERDVLGARSDEVVAHLYPLQGGLRHEGSGGCPAPHLHSFDASRASRKRAAAHRSAA